jgi:opacity protein-like surface antigen
MKRIVAGLALAVAALWAAPAAHADQVAYLVNVTVRPGYNFPNADAALGYGYSVCDRVQAKMGYAQLVDEVNRDFGSADYYQGAYLINQAVNELCPAQIWQLRQSAAGYTLPA